MRDGSAQGEGPAGAYRALLAAGSLSYDEAQDRAVGKLQQLHAALKDYTPAGRTGGLFSFFSSGPGRSDPPRGLYVCGDVGRGKSMLMDLFFAAAPVEPRRRVHFHALML